MKFDYKTDFKIGEIEKKCIDKKIRKKEFYINEEKIIVSKEHKKHERGSKYYMKNKRREKHNLYYDGMMELCKKYYSNFNQILEVGAGFGVFTEMFIKFFQPKFYTIYEFSSTINTIKEKTKEISCKVEIKNESFKNIFDIKKYDCVIALEVLEHINWDKEFLSSFKSGTWIFLSLPVTQAYEHVRGYLVPDSIAYRYRKILNIYEIKKVLRAKTSIYKPHHIYPTHWVISSQRK